MTNLTATDLEMASIPEIAAVIREDWDNVYFAARPYLASMFEINHVNDRYGADDGRGIVTYFLINAGTWRGHVARLVKAELRKRTGVL